MSEPNQSHDEAPPSTVLAKRGDVILLLGKEIGNCGKLLVSSAILSTVSPVFEAMFDGRFAEGQALSANKPKEIPMPDDDPFCITTLCRIIHFKTNDVPAELSMKQLADFAVLCDKYHCFDAARPWCRVWVAQLASEPAHPEFETLLFATYILDLPHEFRQVSRSFITDRATPTKIDVATHGHQLLPLRILDRIHADREAAFRKGIRAILPEAVERLSRSDCDAARQTTSSFVKCLHEARLWPPLNLTLSSIKNQLSQMESIPKISCKKGIRASCCAGNKVSKEDMVQEVHRIIKSVNGYCLDCLKGEASGVAVRPCRIPHV